jgi:hypothetical protein
MMSALRILFLLALKRLKLISLKQPLDLLVRISITLLVIKVLYIIIDSRPSAFVMVGAALPNSIINNKPLHPHHSNIFDFDEKAMMVGLKFWLSLVDEL